MSWHDKEVYRVARKANGDLIHISEAAEEPREQEYYGVTCLKPVDRKTGKIRAWHFSHRERCLLCKPESDLHYFTKLAIRDGVNQAIAEGQQYQVCYRCPDCNSSLRVENIAHWGGRAETEKEVYSGIRSDVVIYSRFTRPIVVEVIVTHEDPACKRETYAAHRTPVLYIRPGQMAMRLRRYPDAPKLDRQQQVNEWEESQRKVIAILRTGLSTNEYSNISVGACSNPSCAPKEPDRRYEYERDTEGEALEDFQQGLWKFNKNAWIGWNDEHDDDDNEDEGDIPSEWNETSGDKIDDPVEAVDGTYLPHQEPPPRPRNTQTGWEDLNRWLKEKSVITDQPHSSEWNETSGDEIGGPAEAVDETYLPYLENPLQPRNTQTGWEDLNQWLKEKGVVTEQPHPSEDEAANYARWEAYDRQVDCEYQRQLRG